jgi:hypothetical protein
MHLGRTRCRREVSQPMPPETPEVRVHYAKGWAIVIIVGAALLLVMAPFVRTWMTGVIGALNLIVGILMLTRPLYVLGDGALQVKNLFGMTMRRYSYRSLSQFEVEPAGAIWHTDEQGTRRKVRISRLTVASADWKRLIDTLATRAFE